MYGFEGVDNGGRAAVELAPSSHFQVEARPELLGGVRVLAGHDAGGKPIVAIPFYTMANREKSVQEVWVTQRRREPNDAWWEGRLYRNANVKKQEAVARVPPKGTPDSARESPVPYTCGRTRGPCPSTGSAPEMIP